MSEQLETKKTIAVYATEGYHTFIVREPLELNIEDYPELEGMSIEEAMDYVICNASEMQATNSEFYSSLEEELNDRDIHREKINNESMGINADLEMF